MKFGRCHICGMLFRRPTRKQLRHALRGHKYKRHPKEMKNYGEWLDKHRRVR